MSFKQNPSVVRSVFMSDNRISVKVNLTFYFVF